MKKFFSLGFISILSAVFFLSSASAEVNFPLQNNIVANPQVIINYDGDQDNPLKTIVHTISKDLFLSGELDLNRDDIEAIKAIDELLISNNINFVLDTNNLGYFIFEGDTEHFDYLLEMFQDFEGMSEIDHNGTLIYSPYNRDEFAIAYHNQAILLAQNSQDLIQVINSLETASADLSDYTPHLQNNSFLSVILTTNPDIPGFESIMNNEVLVSSVSQTEEDTYKIVSYTQGNEEEFQSYDFSYDLFTFNPEMYKHIPGETPSFYLEMNNLSGLIDKALEMSEIVNELDSYEYESLSAFQETPFYQLFAGNVALSVEFKAQTIPYINFISSVNDPEIAKAANKLVNELLAETFMYSEQYDIEEGLYGEERNQAIQEAMELETDRATNTFSTDLTAELPEDEQSSFADLSHFELNYGLFNNFYYISNYPDLEGSIQEMTISDNEQFTSLLKPALESDIVFAYSYFEPNSLAEYISYMSEKINELNGDLGTNEYLDKTIEILAESGPWYAYTLASNYSATETSVIRLPITRFADFLSTSAYELSSLSGYDRTPYYLQYEFNDVNFDNAWYGDDLLEAADRGIIDGGDDYMFHPADPATRGMFVEMLIKHYRLENVEAPLASSIFDDIEEGSEYDRYLGIAYQEGIIQGDSDANTVRPYGTLNRAEAVQMLRNYASVLYGVEAAEHAFNDVEDTDWFADAVGAAVAKEITQGTTPTTFEPNKPLNRAEAIVFINRIANQEFRLF